MSREQAIDLVRAVSPDWLEVTAREDPFRNLIEVSLRVRGWLRRRLLSRFERAVLLSRACVALADAPAGVAVRVRWV